MDIDEQTMVRIYYTLGTVYCEIYELDKALEVLNKALKIRSIHKNFTFKIWLIMGQIEEEKSSFGNAINCYKQALDLDINNRRAYAYLAWCCFKIKDKKQCSQYTQALNDSISNGIDEEACICRYIQARHYAESYNSHDAIKVLKD